MKKVVFAFFVFLCLFNPFNLSISLPQAEPSGPHAPVLFYLGVIAEGYPEAMLWRELGFAKVNVLELKDGMILFGINDQTELTVFFRNLPFLKKIYVDRKDLSNDPTLSTKKITQHFIWLANRTQLFLFENKLRSSKTKENLLPSFKQDDRQDIKKQDGELQIEKIRTIDRVLRERGNTLDSRRNVARGSDGTIADLSPFKVTNLSGPTIWAKGETSAIESLSLSQGISGRVTNSLGVGIAYVGVNFYDQNYNGFFSSTDENGNYLASDLPAGQYKILFSGGAGPYVAEWYDNKARYDEADPVTVSDGQITSNINAQMDLGGIISGRVINIQGFGISDVGVFVYDSNGYCILGSSTSSDGYYEIWGAPPTNLKLYFYPYAGNYLLEWYDNKNSFSAADEVIVYPGQTTTANAVLEQAGAISGRVMNESGIGIDSVYISVYDETGSPLWWLSSWTDSNGNYLINSVPSGVFRVYFDANYNTAGYVSEWYNGKKSYEEADWVYVTAPAITENINAQLALGSSIFGRVTDKSGIGIESVEVDVYDLFINRVSYGFTDGQGYYSVGGIPPGEYKIVFCSLVGNYIPEYFNDKPSFETADPVTVSGGLSKEINAVLASGGSISGRITAFSEIGPYDVIVEVYDLNGGNVSATYYTSNGEYTVSQIPAGNFKVRFYEWGPHFPEWYNDKPSFELADPVTVKAEQTTSLIEAYLSSIRVYDPNSGTVCWKGEMTGIYWVSFGPTSAVNISLYCGLIKVMDIATNTTCDGYETWTIPRSLAVNKDYRVLVEDIANPQEKSFSEPFKIRASLALEAPVLLSPVDGATNQPLSLDLQWQDTNYYPYELYYEVRIKEAGGDYIYYLVPADGTSYFVSGLKPNKKYFWNVRALGDKMPVKNSFWANEEKDWEFRTSK